MLNFLANMDAATTEAIREILADSEPLAVYVFGSTAMGRVRPDSDLDLAILAAKSISPHRLLESRLRLSESIGRDVDLIDLSASSTVLRKEVVGSGRLLYETDRVRREEFEMYALSDYARLNEEREPILIALGQPLRRND
jgi:predicted nucleotidyltransferase